MSITKQPQKSKIFINPRNKTIQSLLIKRNKPINEQDVSRVMQTYPTNNEREVGKAVRVVQTDPTIFELVEKKLNASSDDSGMNPIVTIKPTVESFESIMKNVKLKEAHKIKCLEIVLDLILQSNISISIFTLSINPWMYKFHLFCIICDSRIASQTLTPCNYWKPMRTHKNFFKRSKVRKEDAVPQN